MIEPSVRQIVYPGGDVVGRTPQKSLPAKVLELAVEVFEVVAGVVQVFIPDEASRLFGLAAAGRDVSLPQDRVTADVLQAPVSLRFPAE